MTSQGAHGIIINATNNWTGLNSTVTGHIHIATTAASLDYDGTAWDITGGTVTVEDLIVSTAYTVATLPTGTVGHIARVTDASAPSVGSTVAGSGAAFALVVFNGTNWTVMGV